MAAFRARSFDCEAISSMQLDDLEDLAAALFQRFILEAVSVAAVLI